MSNYITITDNIYLFTLKLENYSSYSKKTDFYGPKFVISRLIYEWHITIPYKKTLGAYR